MNTVHSRHVIRLGLITILILVNLHRVPGLIAASWRNLGAVSIIMQLAKDETSAIDDFVNSEYIIQDMAGWKTSIKSLENSIYWSPGNARSHYLLYTAYWNVGKFSEINLFSDDILCNSCVTDDLLVLLVGITRYQQGNSSEAWRIWELTPDLDIILSELGFRFLRNGERAKMYEFWEGAETVNPTPKRAKARMYKYMCDRSFRFQEWSEAERWCRQWQSAQPSPRADLLLAHALIGNNDVEGAKSLVDNVRDSVDSSMKSQVFWLDSRIAAEQGQWETAFDNFERAVELTPDNPALYLHYATVLLEAGRVETAMVMLDKSEQLDNGTLAPQIAQIRTKVK